jgi:hypothetical protein
MSPTEFDLRQALRDGEGDGVDAGLIIFAARERRAHRRHVLLSAAAAVIVVGGVAGGITALAGNSPGDTSAAGANAPAGLGSSAGPSLGGTHRAPTGRDVKPGNAPLPTADGSGPYSSNLQIRFRCARQPVRTTLPGSGTASLGATGELLAGPVSEYHVCVTPFRFGTAGPAPRAAKPQHITLTGSAADALTTSIENASRAPARIECPMIRTAETVVISIVPVTPAGKTLAPIVVSSSLPLCNAPITNGTSVRYNWQVPRRLQRVLDISAVASGSVTGPENVAPGASGAASGSPVH